MNPRQLDHVALFVSEPERCAQALLARLPFRVLERSDEFVLVGRSRERSKVTLFGADDPREPGNLVRVGIGVPCALAATSLDVSRELPLELVPAAPEGEVEIDHLALLVRDPAASARDWLRFGFEPAARIGGVERVRLGSAFVELHPGFPRHTDRPVLNHLGLLVESLDEVRRAAADSGIEIEREVEAENSTALFVRGPDGVQVEYIEHDPSFAEAGSFREGVARV